METTRKERSNGTEPAEPDVLGEEAVPVTAGRPEVRGDAARVGRGALVTAAVLGALLLAVAVTAVQTGGPGRGARPQAAHGCTPGHSGGQADIPRLMGCLGPSLAYVRTPVGGTGSGVLVDGGFVVTNAHVVVPFDKVRIVLGGSERHARVPVLGVDLHSDLALLGPIQTTRRALPIAGSVPAASGDTVFLAGYPGEVEDDPEPSVTRGILSRTRRLLAHGLTYLQTDATISGGQSGGALVDGAGRVIGISGHSLADGEFALALAGPDVRRSMRRILAGDVPRYRPFPEAARGLLSGTVYLADSFAAQVLTVATEEEITVQLTVPAEAQPAVLVTDLYREDILYENAASQHRRRQLGEEVVGDSDAEEVPGVFEVDLPAGTYALVHLGTARAGGGSVPFESTVPLGLHNDDDDGRTIGPGQTVKGEIEALEAADFYLLDLEAGDEVEIHAASATGDVAFAVYGPGKPTGDGTVVDDSGAGPYGLDAKERYEATASGVHELWVYTADMAPAGYVLEVAAVDRS